MLQQLHVTVYIYECTWDAVYVFSLLTKRVHMNTCTFSKRLDISKSRITSQEYFFSFFKFLIIVYILIHVILVGLTLGENCLKEDQCSITKYASRCLQNQTTKTNVCSCMKGYISSGSNASKVGTCTQRYI